MTNPRAGRGVTRIEEFLRFESAHSERHEYVAGDVYAMAGATLRHSQIVQNIAFHLMSGARRSRCGVHTHALKVQVGDDRVYYPDVVVLCSALPGDTVVVRNPSVIVEVTSPSTARIDRGEKLDAYRRLTSLEAYVVVDQRRRRVDRHWRDVDGLWQRQEYVIEGAVSVPGVDAPITLDEIYERVDVPRVSEPEIPEYEAP